MKLKSVQFADANNMSDTDSGQCILCVHIHCQESM